VVNQDVAVPWQKLRSNLRFDSEQSARSPGAPESPTSEPTFVPWFESNVLIVHFAKQCKESSTTASIEFKARRKLKQDGAELLQPAAINRLAVRGQARASLRVLLLLEP
jgi:hypothetical protein